MTRNLYAKITDALATAATATAAETATDAGTAAATDRGTGMSLCDGSAFFPLDARPEEIGIETIGRALSRSCRYNGQLRDDVEYYSVAQHSVWVSYHVPAEDALCALLHDATEAYLGDMIRPLKKAMPMFVEVEDRLWRVIAERFGLPAEMPDTVKRADNVALATEKRDLLAERQDLSWGPLPDADAERITDVLLPNAAYAAFLARFAELTEARDAATA